jgi:hypothetical protein
VFKVECFSSLGLEVGTHGLILFPSGGLGSCRPVLLVPGVVQEGVRVARLERYSGGRSGYNLKLIPNNEEKYISFSKILRMDDNGYIELRFIDSFRFLASGLDNLLSNLESSQLTEIIKYFSNHKLDMLFRREKSKIIRKGIYPYEYIGLLCCLWGLCIVLVACLAGNYCFIDVFSTVLTHT